jgi:hypothetical protein
VGQQAVPCVVHALMFGKQRVRCPRRCNAASGDVAGGAPAWEAPASPLPINVCGMHKMNAVSKTTEAVEAISKPQAPLQEATYYPVSQARDMTSLFYNNIDAVIRTNQILATGMQDLVGQAVKSGQSTLERSITAFRSILGEDAPGGLAGSSQSCLHHSRDGIGRDRQARGGINQAAGTCLAPTCGAGEPGHGEAGQTDP